MRRLEEPEWIRDHAARSIAQRGGGEAHEPAVFGRCAPGRGKANSSAAPQGSGCHTRRRSGAPPGRDCAVRWRHEKPPRSLAARWRPACVGPERALRAQSDASKGTVRHRPRHPARPHPDKREEAGVPRSLGATRGGNGEPPAGSMRKAAWGTRRAGEGSRQSAGSSPDTRVPFPCADPSRGRGGPCGEASAATRPPQGTHPGRPGHRQRPAGWSAPVDRSTGSPRRA